MSNVEAVLGGLVRESLHELLEAYAISTEESANAPGEPETTAFVGFAGDAIKGGLLLIASDATLRRTRPRIGPADDEPGQRELSDWLSELCNQLMGRLKNKLLPRQVTVYITVPSIVHGRDLHPDQVSGSDGNSERVGLRQAGGSFQCFLNAEYKPEFVIPELPEGYVSQQSEGDMLLF